MVRAQRWTNTVSLLTLGVMTGCHPATTVRLNLTNPSSVPVIVDLTNTDDREQPLRSDSRRVPAAVLAKGEDGNPVLGSDGKPVLTPSSVTVEWNNVRRLSKLKVEYRPESSTARFTVDPVLTVHDSLELYTKEISVGGVHVYDRSASEAVIDDLAKALGGGGQALLTERLVDIVPFMGTVVVATFKMNADGAETAQVHGSVHLFDAKYEHAPSTQLRSTITTDQQVLAKAASVVSLLTPVVSQMNASDVYRLAWSIQHTPVQNASFEVTNAMEQASVAQLRSLHNLLAAYPESTIAVLSDLQVVESASFGITGGHTIANNSSASGTSVFTGTAAYSFGLDDEAYLSLPGLVVNVRYNKQTDRESTLGLLQKLIKNKALSDTPPAASALKSLKEAVRNAFTPAEQASATVLREALKQPRL